MDNAAGQPPAWQNSQDAPRCCLYICTADKANVAYVHKKLIEVHLAFCCSFVEVVEVTLLKSILPSAVL